MKNRALFCLIAAMGVLSLVADNNYYVVPPGTAGVPENPDYRSWATAGTNIHEAVYLSNTVPAKDSTQRDQMNRLYVKSGFYLVTNQLTLTDCRYEIRSSKGPGAEDEFDRDGTILCGSYPATTNRVFRISAGTASRCSQIRGLTVTNGYLGTLTTNGRGAGYYGAGIAITSAAHPFTGVYDCRVVGNTVFCGQGAGICSMTVGGVISNCLIACNLVTNKWYNGYNQGDCGGGGISLNSTGGAGTSRSTRTSGCRVFDCVISNNLVTGNTADGGGIHSGRAGHWIEGCTLIDNRVVGSNPGNAASGCTIYCDRFARVYNCLVTNNTRATSAYNAGIGCGACSIVSNCTVIASCGGISVGGNSQGGVTQPSEIVDCYMDGCGTGYTLCRGDSKASVRNCYITGSTSDSGAVNSPPDTCLYENCTIVRNYRGVRTGSASCIPFVNCVFDNRYIKNSQDISVPGTHSKPGASLTNCWFYSTARINSDMFRTNCVFSTKPGFVDWDNADYHLQKKSVLREAGVMGAWMADAKDLDGKTRVLDRRGRSCPSALPDIGCYECDILRPGTAIFLR